MRWKKLGQIYCASRENNYMQTHALNPIQYYLYGNVYRIYFSACDAQWRGRIFFLEYDLEKRKIVKINTEPVVDIGAYGFFDDNGVLTSDIIECDGKIRLYLIGLSIKNKIMFDAAIGVAFSEDGGKTFQKFSGPILDRSLDDPCFSTAPGIMYEDGIWHLWYVSCEKWLPYGNGYRHFYNIKHRFSDDGIYWKSPATTSITFANDYEYAFARPFVLKENGIYKMWYSFRAQPGVETYRIGYAESADGEHWTRMDEKMHSFDVSENGWDSEMLCCARIFDHNGNRYMLYNGNHYGKTGFGIAVLEDE